MITYLSFSLLLNILLIFSNHINPIYCQPTNNNNNDNQVSGRVFPGCALTENKIYCFGGFIGSASNNGVDYEKSINDHIELDLSTIGNFSVIDKSKIQWTNRSNTVDGIPLGGVGQIATAVLSDGSYLTYGGRYADKNTHPFAVYHPQSDQWNGILLPNNTFYIFTQIVNLGNDQIWIWGGNIPVTLSTLRANMFYIYDYKSGRWPTVQNFTENVLVNHSATLVNNTIYLIGGSSTNVNKVKVMVTFSVFKTYNTINGTWGNITTDGSKPTNRAFHTTVATDDNKYLIIYGGSQPLKTSYNSCDDSYYVYDIEKNNIQGVNITNPPGSTTYRRFGHYAAIYNSSYLLLVFGYSDLNTPATNNLNVLNIQNPLEPKWVLFANNADNSPQSTDGGSNGVDLKTIVPAVVVPVVVVLLGATVALFFFIRHRKNEQKNQFILEQEDPRKLIDINNVNNNDGLYSEEVTNITSNPSESKNSLTFYRNKQDDISETHDHHNYIKPTEFNGTTKPYEPYVTTKPSQLNS